MRKNIFILLCLSILLTGCYDKVETEDRSYVVLMGIDSGKMYETIAEESEVFGEQQDYVLSVGEAKIQNSIGNDSEAQKTKIVSGNSMSEMKQTVQNYSDKDIYFGQLKAILINKEILMNKDMLEKTIYDFERMWEINTKVLILGVDGTAAQSVETFMKKEEKGGMYLWDYYRNNNTEAGFSEYMDFEHLIKSLKEESVFIIPTLKIDDSEMIIDGGIILKGSAFISEIDSDTVMGVKWFEEAAKGVIVSNGVLSLKVSSEKVKVSVDGDNITIRIKVKGTLENGNPDNLGDAERDLEYVIKRILENVIDTARELNSDFIHITKDGEISDKNINLDVDVKLVSTGVIK